MNCHIITQEAKIAVHHLHNRPMTEQMAVSVLYCSTCLPDTQGKKGVHNAVAQISQPCCKLYCQMLCLQKHESGLSGQNADLGNVCPAVCYVPCYDLLFVNATSNAMLEVRSISMIVATSQQTATIIRCTLPLYSICGPCVSSAV